MPKKWFLPVLLLVLSSLACRLLSGSPTPEPLTLPPTAEATIPTDSNPTEPEATPTEISSSEPPAQKTQAPTEAVSPTSEEPPASPQPPDAVEVAAMPGICERKGDMVAVDGLLRLPQFISCSGGSGGWCTIHLLDPLSQSFLIFGMPIRAGDGPGMADLPATYASSDFQVTTSTGQVLGEGDLVRITGLVDDQIDTSAGAGSTGKAVDCSLLEVSSITPLDEIVDETGASLAPLTLVEAAQSGQVDIEITGDDLVNASAVFTSKADAPLAITLEAGTQLLSDKANVTNLALRQTIRFGLLPGEKRELHLPVVSLNMKQNSPSIVDDFTVSAKAVKPELLQLLALPEFRFAPLRVQQYAVWVITDNPTVNGFVETGMFGRETAPTSDELAEVRRLLEAAGLDPAKYKAFK